MSTSSQQDDNHDAGSPSDIDLEMTDLKKLIAVAQQREQELAAQQDALQKKKRGAGLPD